MRYTGYLKSHDSIVLMTVFFPFLFIALDVGPAYKTYYNMLSMDMSELLSTSLAPAAVDSLQDRY